MVHLDVEHPIAFFAGYQIVLVIEAFMVMSLAHLWSSMDGLSMNHRDVHISSQEIR
jgi:hypothetical protein